MKSDMELTTSESSTPIFIIGAQRSGTTLLRLILNAGEEIAIPEEGTFFMPLFRMAKNKNIQLSRSQLRNFLEYLKKNTQFALWGIPYEDIESKLTMVNQISISELLKIIYQSYANAENKVRWGDKTPSFFRMVPLLAILFPKAKFIHIVRDGRDLYLSWKKMDPSKSNPAVTALEWKFKVNKAKSDMESYAPGRFLEIKYEDLVLDSEKVIKTVCEFSNLTYDKAMFQFWTKSDKYIGKHHSELIFSGVTNNSAGKWQKVAEKERKKIRYFEIVSQNTLSRYGYVNTLSKVSVKDKLFVLSLIVVGLPKRLYQVIKTKIVLDFSMRFGRATNASGGN